MPSIPRILPVRVRRSSGFLLDFLYRFRFAITISNDRSSVRWAESSSEASLPSVRGQGVSTIVVRFYYSTDVLSVNRNHLVQTKTFWHTYVWIFPNRTLQQSLATSAKRQERKLHAKANSCTISRSADVSSVIWVHNPEALLAERCKAMIFVGSGLGAHVRGEFISMRTSGI